MPQPQEIGKLEEATLIGLIEAVSDAPDGYGELEQDGPPVLVIQTLNEDVTACSGEYGVPHLELGLFVLGVLGEEVLCFCVHFVIPGV